MDGMTLLQEARGAGLTVTADGSVLKIQGPRRADQIARQLLVHKSCVLSALAVERLPAPPPDVSNEILSLWNKSEADALIAEAIRWLEKVPTLVRAEGHQRRWTLMDKVDEAYTAKMMENLRSAVADLVANF